MFSFSRVRISVTVPVRPTDKKSLSDCAELVDETPRFTTEYTDEYINLSCPIILILQPVAKWLALALPVADAVSYLNLTVSTSHHSM